MTADHASIRQPLLEHTARHPDKLLFAFLDKRGRTTESYTYEAFEQRTNDIAAHICRNHALQPGDRVLLIYPPGLEVICAFFACVRLGLIPVPAYPPSSHGFAAALHRMNYIAEDCGAAAVLTDRAYFWSLTLHRLRTRVAQRAWTSDYSSALPWIVSSDAMARTSGDRRDAHSDVLFLQYTSGSTTAPRGVIVTHENILHNCRITVDHVPIGVSWLPQYHDMGLIGSYIYMALKGGTTYGLSPVDFLQRPLLWLETMSRVRATISAAPNFAYAYCVRPDKVSDDDITSLDLSSVEVLMNAAEPVRAGIFRSFIERFEPYGLRPRSFFVAYGLAEYTLAVSNGGSAIRTFDAARLAAGEARPATGAATSTNTTTLLSCGRPLEGVETRIVAQNGSLHNAHPAQVGEVWLSGPSKCRGYWKRAGLTDETFRARLPNGDASRTEWLRTGDLGFMLDGELFICGRTKDLIIIRGANYYPQDIESFVERDAAIRTGSVAAFATDDRDGERVIVVAELRSAKRLPDTASIARGIREHLGLVPDAFVYVAARTLPKTSSGKLMRQRARAMWHEKAFAPIAIIETRTECHDGETGPAGRAAPGMDALARTYGLTGRESCTLTEAGLDSLRIVEFAAQFEQYLESMGAHELASSVDVRWLQRIAISELFDLTRQLSDAAPDAQIRFRHTLIKLQREQGEQEQTLMREDARLSFAPPAARSNTRARTSSSAVILLTGATGFLGPFLLKSLLEQRTEDIHVLIRAQDDADAIERLRRAFAWLGEPMDAGALLNWERRVVPVCGDLARPRLGLTADRWAFLSEHVETIFSNGALVNYLSDYASMRATNVGGTNELVRLALDRRAKSFNHISSTFMFGWSTRATLHEHDNNDRMELLDFGYSQSKWVSEQVVFDAMQHGLCARVFRPALITPSVTGGGYNFDIAIRLLVFMIKHGMSTTAQNQVSFSPADVVANNIVAIAGMPSSVGKTFHVTRDEYANMQEITDIFTSLLGTRFSASPVDEFVQKVIGRCQPDDLLFPLMNFLVRSADNITAMEFKRYCNRNYREARDQSPFGLPDPPLHDVVSGIARFMQKHRIIDVR